MAMILLLFKMLHRWKVGKCGKYGAEQLQLCMHLLRLTCFQVKKALYAAKHRESIGTTVVLYHYYYYTMKGG